MNDSTEWLKIMLGEIDRKRIEDREAREEAERRDSPDPGDRPESSAK